MKKKRIEAIPVPDPKRESDKITGKAQTDGDYLILDLFRNRKHTGRYVIDKETGEHADRTAEGMWSRKKFLRVIGFDPLYTSYYRDEVAQSFTWDTKEDKETAEKMLGAGAKIKNEWMRKIEILEEDYDKDRRIRTKENKYKRIDQMMQEIPEETEGFREWIYETGCRERYLFYNEAEKNLWMQQLRAADTGKSTEKAKTGENRTMPGLWSGRDCKKTVTEHMDKNKSLQAAAHQTGI